MLRIILLCASMFGLQAYTMAEEPVKKADEGALSAEDEGTETDDGRPKTMFGMSILGNEEAPKSLVIVPWKSSELGAELSLSDTLDDRARPVDREVFMRELSYHDLRSAASQGVQKEAE